MSLYHWISIAVMAVAVILLFMTWVSLSSYLVSAGSFALALLGSNSSSLATEYSMFNISTLGGVLTSIANTASSYGSSSETESMKAFATLLTIINGMVVVGALCFVASIVLTFVNRKGFVPALVGAIILALMSGVMLYAGVSIAGNSELSPYVSVNMVLVVLELILDIAAIVLAVMAKSAPAMAGARIPGAPGPVPPTGTPGPVPPIGTPGPVPPTGTPGAVPPVGTPGPVPPTGTPGTPGPVPPSGTPGTTGTSGGLKVGGGLKVNGVGTGSAGPSTPTTSSNPYFGKPE